MQENFAAVDIHVDPKLFLKQINIFLTIHGGFRQKNKFQLFP